MALTITGGLYIGPILHVWYSRFLPQLVNKVSSGAASGAASGASASLRDKIKSAIPGTLFDQLLFAPPFLFGFFIFSSFVTDFTI